MSELQQHTSHALDLAILSLQQFRANDEEVAQLTRLAMILADTFLQGGKVLICGNGGSYCDALHFAEEFTGQFRKTRKALPAMALGEGAHMSCVANDFGWDKVFSRQVEAFGQKNDLLIALSTSGNSGNILAAIKTAKNLEMQTAAFLGKSGGKIKGLCDFEFIIPGDTSDRIQEVHMCMLHILIEDVERVLFPELYQDS